MRLRQLLLFKSPLCNLNKTLNAVISLQICVCAYASLPFRFVFSICRLLCITFVGKWNLCTVLWFWKANEGEISTILAFISFFFHHWTVAIVYIKDPKICMYSTACFALSRCLAPLLRNVHRSPTHPTLCLYICLYFKRRNLLEHKHTLNI